MTEQEIQTLVTKVEQGNATQEEITLLADMLDNEIKIIDEVLQEVENTNE